MHPNYSRLLGLSLFLFLCNLFLSAQSYDDQLFRLTETPVELSPEVKSGLKQYTLLTVDRGALQHLLRRQPAQLRTTIPFEEGLDVTLHPSDLFADGFLLRAGSKIAPDTVAYEGGGYYQGKVAGEPNSVAAVSFFADDVIGVLADAKGNINLGRLPGSADDGETLQLIMYRESDIVARPQFSCAVPDPVIKDARDLLPHEEMNGGMQKMLPNVCFSSYLEGDYDLFQSRSSNLTNATNWLTGVWNVVNALFNNDQITADISEIFIWTTPDGYPESSSGAAHNAFSSAMNGGFNGDLAHLITRDANGNGGRAWLNVVCSNNSYYKTAYSEISGSYASLPNYSWTINVLTHEAGHNLGSQHTHSCSWNGNNTQIDDAGNVYFANNGQTPEGDDCFDDNNPIIPSNGGTIMSYAHLLSGVGINFSLGFGPQPGNRIRAAIANCSDCSSDPVLGCTDPDAHNYNPAATQNDGSCIDCNDGVQNGDETGVDCGGALCAPCGCSSYTDPVFTLPSTLCAADDYFTLPAVSNNNFTGQWYLGTTVVTGFDPAVYGGQNVSLQFIPAEGQCANVYNTSIAVTAAVLPTFDIPQQFCATDPGFNLDNVSLNGVSGSWSLNGNPLNFQFFPALFGPGVYTLDFVPENGQCAEIASFVVEVIDRTICDPIVGCTDQNAHNYNPQATQSDGSCETCFDGIMNGDETEIDCGGSLCEPCGCTVYTTPVFNNLPTVVCADGDPFGLPALSSNGLIGVWSLNGFTVNFIDPANYAGQTLELTFTPNADQCGEIITVDIDIPETAAPQFSFSTEFCANDPIFNLPTASDNSVTGRWYRGNNQTFFVDPAQYAGQSVNLRFVPDQGQCSQPLNISLSVDPETVPEFNLPAVVCATDGVIHLDNVSLNGVQGSWFLGGNTLNFQFFPALFGAGAYELEFVPDNTDGCTVTARFDITVEAREVCDPIEGCTDPDAHNYNPQATQSDDSCETCSDGILNGDETEIDCGGSLCEPCGCEVYTTPTFTALEDTLCSRWRTFTLPGSSSNGLTGSWIPASLVTDNVLDLTDLSNETITLVFVPDAGSCGMEIAVDFYVNDDCTPQDSLIIAGAIYTPDSVYLDDLPVMVTDSNQVDSLATVSSGTFVSRWPLLTDSSYLVQPLQPTDSLAARAGIDILDLITLRRYLLGYDDLNLYQLIAADVDGSAQLNVFDMIIAAKLVLGTQDTLPDNRVYQYIDAEYVFPDANNPWAEAIPDYRIIDALNADSLSNDFLAIKLGDLTALAGDFNATPTELIQLNDQSFSANQLVEVTLPASARRGSHDMVYLEVNYDPATLRWVGRANIADAVPQLISEAKPGVLKLWWLADAANAVGAEEISLSFISRTAGQLAENFSLGTNSSWLNDKGESFFLETSLEAAQPVNRLTVYPNPTRGLINYQFTTPDALDGDAVIATLTELGGRTVWIRELGPANGSFDLRSGRTDLSDGVYFLTLRKGDLVERRKIVLLGRGN